MDKLFYYFKSMPFKWLNPKLPIDKITLQPNARRNTMRPHPERYFTTEALDFLHSLGIHTSPRSILLLGIPPGMAVAIHTDYYTEDTPDLTNDLYRGHWSLNVPITTDDVYTEWFDGPLINNHVYTEEEAGNMMYEANIQGPNILRTDIPHRVNNRGSKTTWRVCLRCDSPIKSWDDAVSLLGPYIEK